MTFLAILKDSLREALDTKVFYVMVALSLLVVFFVSTVSYRPVSVEEQAANAQTWLERRRRNK